MSASGAYSEHLARVPLFSGCAPPELRRLARRATSVTVEAGDAVIKEGRTGFEFFVILRGEAEVNGAPTATLAAGDFFGELALLDDGPRNATITAVTPMELIVLTRAEFDAALAEAPAMARRLMTGMAGRLRAVDAERP